MVRVGAYSLTSRCTARPQRAGTDQDAWCFELLLRREKVNHETVCRFVDECLAWDTSEE
jgi:hypothetical protein